MAKKPTENKLANNRKAIQKPTAKKPANNRKDNTQAIESADVQEGGVFTKSWRSTIGGFKQDKPIIWRLQSIKWDNGKVTETWRWEPDTIGAAPVIAAPMAVTQQ